MCIRDSYEQLDQRESGLLLPDFPPASCATHRELSLTGRLNTCGPRATDQPASKPSNTHHTPSTPIAVMVINDCRAYATAPAHIPAMTHSSPKPMEVSSRILPATNSIPAMRAVSYTHLRAHETVLDLVCR